MFGIKLGRLALGLATAVLAAGTAYADTELAFYHYQTGGSYDGLPWHSR